MTPLVPNIYRRTGPFYYVFTSGSCGNQVQAGSNGPLANTTRSIDGWGHLLSRTMVIYTNYNWWTGGTPIPSGYYDLKTVLRHELGHGLGLCHSGTPGTLMYRSTNPA